MDAQDVLTEARQLLSDESKIRWSDVDLFPKLTTALYDVKKERPDLLLVDGDSLTDVAEVTSIGQELPFGLDMLMALSLLTASNALNGDSDDRTNLDRAVAFRKLALEQLGR